METVIKLRLVSVNDVKEFVAAVSNHNGEVFVESGRYKISGKSLMGMFSRNLDEPFIVMFENAIEDTILERVKKYRV